MKWPIFRKPVVTPPLQSFPFSISTTPVPVVATFNLAAAHPLQWMLTLINTTLKNHQDLTGGAPGVDRRARERRSGARRL